MMMLLSLVLAVALLPSRVVSSCYEPTPAFPPPSWEDGASDLQSTFERIEKKLHEIIKKDKYNTSSYSIELTSSSDTLWSTYHTASILNETRPGDKNVSEHSQYRIASITKTFTTLALLHLASDGKLSLDDPVIKHIPELNSSDYTLPWKDTSLRILASQLSGIPREFAQADLYNRDVDTTPMGLPPVHGVHLLPCEKNEGYQPCTRSELLERLKRYQPLFAPNQKSSYSNLNFELLGLAIASITGMPYEQYVSEKILKPLDMTSSSFSTPSDEFAVLPVGGNYWGFELGVQSPTGGLYSSSEDLSKFLRYILTHYNALTTGVNWLMPASWGTGMETFYGMPFEIFRSNKVLKDTRRPVTFTTKGGALPGYYTKILILEEYGLGLSILVGGNSELQNELTEIVSVELVRGAEEAIWKTLAQTHTGSYVATNSSLNSSMEIISSPAKGLELKQFMSNGTSVVPGLFTDGAPHTYAQLVPTLLFKNETSQEGEIWRVIAVRERTDQDSGIWEEFCPTDVDQLSYAGLPLNEVVFWHEEGVVELPAWRVTMKPAKKESEDKLLVQR